MSEYVITIGTLTEDESGYYIEQSFDLCEKRNGLAYRKDYFSLIIDDDKNVLSVGSALLTKHQLELFGKDSAEEYLNEYVENYLNLISKIGTEIAKSALNLQEKRGNKMKLQDIIDELGNIELSEEIYEQIVKSKTVFHGDYFGRIFSTIDELVEQQLQRYYFVNLYHEVDGYMFEGNSTDKKYLERGLMFTTEDGANLYVEALKNKFKYHRLVYEANKKSGFVPDFTDTSQIKFNPYVSYKDGDSCVTVTETYMVGDALFGLYVSSYDEMFDITNEFTFKEWEAMFNL